MKTSVAFLNNVGLPPMLSVSKSASYSPFSSSLSMLNANHNDFSVPSFSISTSDIPVTSSGESFGAVVPDSSAIAAMGIIVVLCVVASLVWANEVVPVSRTKLSISKNKGQVKDYLDELKSTELTDTTEADEEVLANDRSFEKWLFSDWLSNNKSEKKAAAIPFLKKAKWNSGDNPVLVTSGLLLLCVLFASITERAGLMGIR